MTLGKRIRYSVKKEDLYQNKISVIGGIYK